VNRSLTTKTLFIFGLILLSSTVLSTFMLTRDNDWGDDFAAYIMQAQSIARGSMHEYVLKNSFTMQQSSHVFGPITEPWGFPLLLAPVYAVFGLKVLALKLVLVLCYALFLIAFYFLARTRLEEADSLLLTALLAFSPALLTGENEILSDIPFTLFSTLTLWLIVRPWTSRPGSRGDVGQGVVLGLASFAAVFTRIAGFLLFVPLITAQFMRIRRGPRGGIGLREMGVSILLPYVTCGVLYAVQASVFPSIGLRAPLGNVSLQTLSKNLQDYFWVPAYFLRDFVGGARAAYLGLLPFFVMSVVAHHKRDLPLHLYILATLVLLVSREGMAEPRYVYPLWPLLMLMAYDGMKVIAGRLKPNLQPRASMFTWDLFVVLAVASFAACTQIAWTNMAGGRYDYRRSWGAFSPGSSLMFEYIRDKTPTDSVIIFFKPRAMRLRTDRDAFFTTRCEDLPKGDYVAIVKSIGTYDQISPQLVRHCNPTTALTAVYEKDDFVVYQIAVIP
jgi:hypothetical protein